MNSQPKPLRVYAAGISFNGDWSWQGTVVAENKTEAKKLLVSFKKSQVGTGRCEVEDLAGPIYTYDRPKGVSESLILE